MVYQTNSMPFFSDNVCRLLEFGGGDKFPQSSPWRHHCKHPTILLDILQHGSKKKEQGTKQTILSFLFTNLQFDEIASSHKDGYSSM